MVRRGGFGHFGAGGHEGGVEEGAVIARVADHVDDAHVLFIFFFSPFSLFFVFCLVLSSTGGVFFFRFR